MNKKFSTLLSGFLLMSAFASAQVVEPTPVIDVNKLEIVTFDKDVTSGTYFIVQSNDDDLDGADLILSVKKEKNGGLTYKADQILATDGEKSDYVWTFEVKKDGTVSPNYYYALKNNEAGTYLTFSKASGDIVSIADDCGKAEDGKNNTSLFMEDANAAEAKWRNGNNLYAYGVNENNNALNFTPGIGLDANGGNIYLCKYKTSSLPANVATAELFNDVKGGSGFNLKFSSGNSNGWANDILTDLNLKAFVIDGDENIAGYQHIMWGGQGDLCEIPTGVYFATEYPASLNNTNVITTQAQFEACTFLAVNPDKNYDIHAADRANGIGFDLMTVSGADLNVYADQSDDRASVKGDVFVGNACFTIEVPDPLRAENAYNLKLANARVQTDASKNAHVDKEVYIGSILDQNKNYLVTNLEAGALSFETTNSTLYDVTKLLKSEDAPSIYTIQFVSELYKNDNINFAGEKNHYLTVGVQNGVFALHSVVDYNAADPMFQFVITDVDKDNKTVEFTNRQTKRPFTVSLYENEDGSFTVYGDPNDELLWVEEISLNTVDEDVRFLPYNMTNTKVILTPVTVEDKFATFVNRSDNDGLVTFELAKNSDDTPEFYVGATRRNNNGEIVPNGLLVGYANARNITQFELEKVDSDPRTPVVDPSWITNPYVYKKGSRILTSTVEDTVAYYKYQIKVFEELNDDDQPYYVVNNNNGIRLAATVWDEVNGRWNFVNPEEFIIKENIDGSVSLIPTNNVNNDILDIVNLQYLEVNNALRVDAANRAWFELDNYEVESKLNVGLKTFMVEEDPAVSYEAIPQHVSFEAVRGGFMTKDENSDARLSISTQAAEDLTFWLDTVHSDRNVPSFYILKNGAYMFNAADSAQYYGNRGNDRFSLENGLPKLIFKTGELVTSDTLRTTVDGRSVLVAEEDNAPKGIKGGLHNFHFEIVQAEAGSDEYVIRQDGWYVCQTNNYFYLTWDKDEAIRFFIEKQSAPTANEGIEVSEVKVIAGNGQITIMGAAGKKVVVSNILGKVVASQTITSDNATIAVPAGIVAVAVEGEAAVKAIVK